MASPKPRARGGASTTRWVNLARACEVLGVNESTARRWADSGQIRSFRTPGGHRRFAEDDLLAIVNGEQRRRPDELESAAVSRIRRQLSHGPKGTGWYAEIEADERDALRPLGRQLVAVVGDFISRRRTRAEVEAEVDTIAVQYGQLLRERDTPLQQAMEAFTFFRRSLDETAKQLAERRRMTAEEAARAREEIARLADRVLLGISGEYEPNG